MSSLQWEDAPAKTSAKPQLSTAFSNLWFGVAMGLVGIIIGYVLANVLH